MGFVSAIQPDKADQERKVRKPALDSPVKQLLEQEAPRRLSFAQALKNEDEPVYATVQTDPGYTTVQSNCTLPVQNDATIHTTTPVHGDTLQPSRNDVVLNESLVNFIDLRRNLDPGGNKRKPGGDRVNPGGDELKPSGDELKPGGFELKPCDAELTPDGDEVNTGGDELNPGGDTVNLGNGKGCNNCVQSNSPICDIKAGNGDNDGTSEKRLDTRDRISETRDNSIEPCDNLLEPHANPLVARGAMQEEDETTDEDGEQTTKKRTPGKRIRKRRKHQKKPRTPKPPEQENC